MIDASVTSLGIELGSTRIKAVLIGPDHVPLAQGSFQWESRLENGYWTYSLEEVWNGLQQAYADLKRDYREKTGQTLTRVGILGVSAMMHGFLPFDGEGALLTPFRTWRNTTTGQAAGELSQLLDVNIPQRWSIAHLEQAILNKEAYLPRLRFLTTLAGYVHFCLTGKKVLGVGDASGMFPIGADGKDYDAEKLARYEARLAAHGFDWTLRDVLPQVLQAGEDAGTLTDSGARLLDPSGDLVPGIPLAPPEGDAGTGMTATNSVRPRTGNVSAGTSIFSMVVLERPLRYRGDEIDLVTTPDGSAVAMVHCNNGTSDLNAWVGLLDQTLKLFGRQVPSGELYTTLFRSSLNGADDGGGNLVYNLTAGEPVIHVPGGVPMVLHQPDRPFLLEDFLRSMIYGCFAALRLGMSHLDEEQVACDRLTGHGGLFATPGVAQKYLAAALHAPVAVMETAGEGGAYGMALLGAYTLQRKPGQSLADYLEQQVFQDQKALVEEPEEALAAGFDRYLKEYARRIPALREMSEITERMENV